MSMAPIGSIRTDDGDRSQDERIVRCVEGRGLRRRPSFRVAPPGASDPAYADRELMHDTL